MEHKTFTGVELKDVDRDKGELTAVFSTFNVIDKDGDVTYKSSFTEGAPVVISAYGHTSWSEGGGRLPVGKGVIALTNTEAILKGQFFMDTTHGLDTFRTVKALSEGDSLQEWSYSLHNVTAEPVEVGGVKARGLMKIDVKECSPVLLGASIGTRTLATKNRKQAASSIRDALRNAGLERWGGEDIGVWPEDWDPDDNTAVYSIEDADSVRLLQVSFERSDSGAVTLGDDETDVVRSTDYVPAKGSPFREHARSVLTDVDELITRAADVMTLRREQGKALGAESADLLARLDGQLKRLVEVFADPESPPDLSDELAREYARFVAITQGV